MKRAILLTLLLLCVDKMMTSCYNYMDKQIVSEFTNTRDDEI